MRVNGTFKRKKRISKKSTTVNTELNQTSGESVLVRNYNKRRKFDPTFLPDDYEVVRVSNDGRCVTVEKLADGTHLKRHPDDLKRFTKVVDENEGVTPHYSEIKVPCCQTSQEHQCREGPPSSWRHL